MTLNTQAPESPVPADGVHHLSRGDRFWALWFFILLGLTWLAAFIAGLAPSAFGVLPGLLAFMIVPPAMLFGLFVLTLAGPFGEKRRGGVASAFLARVVLLCTAGGMWMLTMWIGGGPWTAGRLCGAKWGTGLDTIRRLQASSEVSAVARTGTAQNLEPIPSYLHSNYWGEPRINIEPSGYDPPVITMHRGGGFLSWGIIACADGECPLDEETFEITPWADGVWVFRGY